MSWEDSKADRNLWGSMTLFWLSFSMVLVFLSYLPFYTLNPLKAEIIFYAVVT